MSVPTTKTPTVVRSHSTTSRPSRAPSDLPHRTRSVAVRSSNTTQPPTPTNLSHSKTPSQDRRPPSNHTALEGAARRELEASNVTRMPRRETSSDRSQERPSTARTETGRRHQRNPSTQSRQRDSVDMLPSSASQLPPQHATATSTPAAAPRRRTTITTPTGQWALGKTIGAGSMGKVKLAKKYGDWRTGTNVRIFVSNYQYNTDYGRRLPLKSCHDSRPRNIAPRGRQREPIAQRRFGQLEKPPSSAW
jgi:hypothetical protein